MSEICDKIDDLRKGITNVKKIVKQKADSSKGNEQLFWINFLIELKDIDYRLYDMQRTIPKYEEEIYDTIK